MPALNRLRNGIGFNKRNQGNGDGDGDQLLNMRPGAGWQRCFGQSRRNYPDHLDTLLIQMQKVNCCNTKNNGQQRSGNPAVNSFAAYDYGNSSQPQS